jgi:hypothetical protein
VYAGEVIEFVTLNHLIDKNGDNLPIWSANIAAAGCEHSLSEPYQSSMLVEMGFIGLGPGVYSGLLHQCKLFNGMSEYRYPETWYVAKALGRMVVAAVVGTPFALLFLLTPEQIPEMWLLAVIGFLIPATMVGYTVFAFADYLSFKIKLYDSPLLDSLYDDQERSIDYFVED